MKKIMLLILCLLIFVSSGLTACQIAREPSNPNRSEKTTRKVTEEISTSESTIEDATTEEVEQITAEETTGGEDETEFAEPPKENEIIRDSSYEPLMQVLEVGFSSLGAQIQVNHSTDVDLRSNVDTSIQPNQKEVVFQIGDVTISATYTGSVSSPYYQDEYHRYVGTNNNGDEISAGFHAVTGKLTDFRDLSAETDLNRPILSENECRSIAEKFFFESINASGEFETNAEYQEVPEFANGVYLFRFQRLLNQMKTDEYADIYVTERGRIIYYRANMLGAMDGISIPDYDEKEASNAVKYKLANIYEPILEQYRCTYEILDLRLTRLYDGKIYLNYMIDVMIHLDAESYYIDTTNLLVCIS